PVAVDQTITTMMNTPVAVFLDAGDADNDPLTHTVTDLPDHGRIDKVIYNSESDYKYYSDVVGREVGDEIEFGLSERILTSFTTEYWAEIGSDESANGRLRIYAIDGGVYSNLDSSWTKPGTVLYESALAELQDGFNSLTFDDILVSVPDTVVWTFQVTSDDTVEAGVVFSGQPDVGLSLDDYWTKTSGSWSLNKSPQENVENNFRAKVFAYDSASLFFVYTPDNDFLGNDSLAYTVDDGKGGVGTATVIINVIDNTAPVAHTQFFNINVNIGGSATIDTGVTDADGDTLTYTIGDNTPAYGTVSFDNGNVTYTSTAVGQNDNFNFVVSDGRGG
ncbi:uncharacterized protein METZ01_LOCUS335834, partial [marine metagenome]